MGTGTNFAQKRIENGKDNAGEILYPVPIFRLNTGTWARFANRLTLRIITFFNGPNKKSDFNSILVFVYGNQRIARALMKNVDRHVFIVDIETKRGAGQVRRAADHERKITLVIVESHLVVRA